MPIVLISESLMLRSNVAVWRLLRDRHLCGFCIRMNPRKQAFKVATSVDEARSDYRQSSLSSSDQGSKNGYG